VRNWDDNQRIKTNQPTFNLANSQRNQTKQSNTSNTGAHTFTPNKIQLQDGVEVEEDLFSRISPRWKGNNLHDFSTDAMLKLSLDERHFARQIEDLKDHNPKVSTFSPNKIVVTFQPGPMGIRVEGNCVKVVHPGSQAECAHVGIGWHILAVNGKTQPNNTRAIDKAIDETYKANKPTDILFLKTNT